MRRTGSVGVINNRTVKMAKYRGGVLLGHAAVDDSLSSGPRRRKTHVCVVSEHADCDITVNKPTHCKIYAHGFILYVYIYIYIYIYIIYTGIQHVYQELQGAKPLPLRLRVGLMMLSEN